MTLTLNPPSAAARRQLLAEAHSRWYSNGNRDEADIALEADLLKQNVITDTDVIESIHREGTTIILMLEDGYCTSLDAYGNVMKGTSE